MKSVERKQCFDQENIHSPFFGWFSIIRHMNIIWKWKIVINFGDSLGFGLGTSYMYMSRHREQFSSHQYRWQIGHFAFAFSLLDQNLKIDKIDLSEKQYYWFKELKVKKKKRNRRDSEFSYEFGFRKIIFLHPRTWV